MATLPCSCYYIEVPYELITSGGQPLYVVYNKCGFGITSDDVQSIPVFDIGSGIAFYVCVDGGSSSVTFKYGFFGPAEFVAGITVTTTGTECSTEFDCSIPPEPSPSNTPTQTPSNTPTQTPSNTPTRTPRPTPSITASPTVTPTQTGTPQPTPSPTAILCGQGFTDVNQGSTYFYTDCCGNFQQGTENKLPITLDYSKPSSGVIRMNVTASVSCPTPTPTVTPTLTPTNTATPTITPTNTTTPTLTRTPTNTPTNSQVVRLKNDCDVFTLFDMGVSCFPIVQPSSSNSLDGILSLKITGGTSPYSIYWAGGQRTQTLVGVPQGSYEVVVVDFYGDYSARTICSLLAPTATITPSPTATPTVTPSGVCPKLCFIATSNVTNYGPLQFNCNGMRNGRTTWITSDGQYNVVWNPTRNRWEITGSNPTTPFNPNGGGIFASTSTSLIPDSSWSIVGGTNTYNVTMTQGNCPAVLPLQASLSVDNNSCDNATNCDGTITVTAQYGYPPYLFSINQGGTYQSSNIFENLCSGQYNIIVRDSSGTQQNVNGTVGFDEQPVTYQLSLSANTSATQTVSIDNYNSRTTYLQVVTTPPLPPGVTISFNLTTSSIKTYNGPGSGTISDNFTITENGVTKFPSTTQSTTQTGDRPNCNPETYTQVTEADTYRLVVGNNSPILIMDESILSVTNGATGAQSNCLTNLTQEIFAQITRPIINGCKCCQVIADDRLTSINSNTVTYQPGVNNVGNPITSATPRVLCGFDGTGTVTINRISGGSGQYEVSEYWHSTCEQAINGVFISIPSTSYIYDFVPNGTQYFGIRDANNPSNSTCVVVNVFCGGEDIR
jgi:hypothetical protein